MFDIHKKCQQSHSPVSARACVVLYRSITITIWGIYGQFILLIRVHTAYCRTVYICLPIWLRYHLMRIKRQGSYDLIRGMRNCGDISYECLCACAHDDTLTIIGILFWFSSSPIYVKRWLHSFFLLPNFTFYSSILQPSHGTYCIPLFYFSRFCFLFLFAHRVLFFK